MLWKLLLNSQLAVCDCVLLFAGAVPLTATKPVDETDPEHMSTASQQQRVALWMKANAGAPQEADEAAKKPKKKKKKKKQAAEATGGSMYWYWLKNGCAAPLFKVIAESHS